MTFDRFGPHGPLRVASMNESDRLLVDQVRRGDDHAWAELIERYEGRLQAFIDSRLRDRSTSEDVVQETFVGFLVSLPHFDSNRDLEAYLFTIASHKMTDYLRKQSRRPVDQMGSDDYGRPLDEVAGSARRASSIARSREQVLAEENFLADCLDQLIREWFAKEDYTRIKCMELLLVHGVANKEVARRLELTEQAVASYKFQVISRLKEHAKRQGMSGVLRDKSS